MQTTNQEFLCANALQLMGQRIGLESFEKTTFSGKKMQKHPFATRLAHYDKSNMHKGKKMLAKIYIKQKSLGAWDQHLRSLIEGLRLALPSYDPIP